jgi:hypothetical protein
VLYFYKKEINMKKCSICKIIKDEIGFSKGQRTCKECYKAYYDKKRPKLCLECKNICKGKRHKYCSNECKIIHNTIKCENGCWEWKGFVSPDGYAQTKDYDCIKTNILAHRLSYKVFKGEIPDGMCVCHACDNRKCCNPKHLWLGTRFDNNKDCFDKGRTIGVSRPGELSPSAKLKNEDVLEIRKKLSEGIRPYLIAKEYKVKNYCIYAIRDRITWRHI